MSSRRLKLPDGTVWPFDPDPDDSGNVNYRLRYGPAGLAKVDRYHASSILSAWAHVLDPNVPFSQIEPQLRQLRRLVKEANYVASN